MFEHSDQRNMHLYSNPQYFFSRHVFYHLNVMVYAMVYIMVFGFVVQSQDCHKITDLTD